MLPQTLKPNEIGVELYKDGKLLGYESIIDASNMPEPPRDPLKELDALEVRVAQLEKSR